MGTQQYTVTLSLTWFAVAGCIMHLLNATSHLFLSGGFDYDDPIGYSSSGSDPPVMSCSYSLTITIPAGSSAGDGVVAIINDTIYEEPEIFFLALSVGPLFQAFRITEGSLLRTRVLIHDDDGEKECFEIFNLLRFTVICPTAEMVECDVHCVRMWQCSGYQLHI